MSAHPYELLAALLDYPEPGLVGLAEECRRALSSRCPAAASSVEAFGAWAASVEPSEVEERFARTFDFHPPHCLDLGFQLFGESYKRGVFLVNVQGAAAALGIAHPHQLADHLTVVLRVLARLPYAAARGHVDEAVLPVVAKVLGAFADPAEPYRLLLEAVREALAADFNIRDIRPVTEERVWTVPGQQGGLHS